MEFTIEEKEWLEKCKQDPERYTIYVDNDCINVVDKDDEDFDFTFNEYGHYFIEQILNYVGCNAEHV